MTIVSLTSIPPRFAGLGPVLEGLLAQGAERVVLALSRRYARFPGPVVPPALPGGVELIWCDDLGPMTKLIPAQAAYPEVPIAICDDDCLYAPGWLAALEVQAGRNMAVAGSVFSVERLKRRGTTVAQGFAGVLLPPGFTCPPPTGPCRYADDLWLSAHLALSGIDIRDCPAARAHVTPLQAAEPLQSIDRAQAYARAAAHIHDILALWPPSAG